MSTETTANSGRSLDTIEKLFQRNEKAKKSDKFFMSYFHEIKLGMSASSPSPPTSSISSQQDHPLLSLFHVKMMRMKTYDDPLPLSEQQCALQFITLYFVEVCVFSIKNIISV